MAKTRIPQGNEDTNFVRCSRCGFFCNTERDARGSGSGVRYEAITHTASTAPDNPIHVAGCPFCNTKNFLNWNQ